MSSVIHFFYEDVKFRLRTVRNTKSWIKDVIRAEGKGLGEINYVFCSDAFLAHLNIQYLQHNTLTDIITFNIAEEVDSIGGDIYISVDRVKENADVFKVSFDQELHRVIIHGVLHLLGYLDKTVNQKRTMRKKEDAYLSLRTF
jgi:rRNA maturation RNase YbeY